MFFFVISLVFEMHISPRTSLDVVLFRKLASDMENIFQPTKMLNEAVYQLIYNILRLGGQPRNIMLSWIGNCIHANIGIYFSSLFFFSCFWPKVVPVTISVTFRFVSKHCFIRFKLLHFALLILKYFSSWRSFKGIWRSVYF